MAKIGPSKGLLKELVEKKKLKKDVDDDMEDEEKGIKTYGKQAVKHPKKKTIFSKIKKDEKKHKGILSRMKE